jgi:hypothetical protein
MVELVLRTRDDLDVVQIVEPAEEAFPFLGTEHDFEWSHRVVVLLGETTGRH